MIAALYIDHLRGPYATMDGVDPWGVDRDARLYRGPYPVVAHPPCNAWGRYRVDRLSLSACATWDSSRFDRAGADMLCGVTAVHQVRQYGGVLEHPAHSALWDFASLPRPGLFRDHRGGFTMEVHQGAFGHECPKPTWLYVVGVDPFSYLEPFRRMQPGRVERQWSSQRHLTPPRFAEFLVSIARKCSVDALEEVPA